MSARFDRGLSRNSEDRGPGAAVACAAGLCSCNSKLQLYSSFSNQALRLLSHLYTLRMNRASDTCGKAVAANGRGMARPDFRLSQALCVRKSVTYRSAHPPDYQEEPAKRDYMRSWKAVRAWAQPRAVTDCGLLQIAG